jgi:hypothetical protein
MQLWRRANRRIDQLGAPQQAKAVILWNMRSVPAEPVSPKQGGALLRAVWAAALPVAKASSSPPTLLRRGGALRGRLYPNPSDQGLSCTSTRRARSRRSSVPQPVLPTTGRSYFEEVTHGYYWQRHYTTRITSTAAMTKTAGCGLEKPLTLFWRRSKPLSPKNGFFCSV